MNPRSTSQPLAPPEICRLPMLIILVSAAAWLVFGSGFALIASIKFHSSSFLAGPAWLTYGRAHPAASSAVLYGFYIPAGLGVSLWLLGRLGGNNICLGWLVTVGAVVWNLGVAFGILGILAGDRTGFPSAELPGYATPMLFIGYLILGLWGALAFHQRREPRLYASQWFLFAALFWFPWIFSTAQLLLIIFPARGVVQAIIAWWYANNLEFVWLWLTGLGIAFYFLPALTGRHLQNRNLALFAFWLILVFSSWGGIPNSAPVPAWMPTLSVVGVAMTILVLLAVAMTAWNTAIGPCPKCAEGSAGQLGAQPASAASPAQGDPNAPSPSCPVRAFLGSASESLPLRFVAFGILAFLVAGLMRLADALPPVGNVTGLTWFGTATSQINAYGFFAMVIFGAAYWIMPRLMGVDFPFPRLARLHFWLAALGIVLLSAPLAVAGVIEGLKLRNPDIAFMDVVKATLPCLRVSTMGDLFMALGHLAFFANLAGLAARFYFPRAKTALAAFTLDRLKTAEAKP